MLVATPLNALVEDQLKILRQRGVPAALLKTSQPQHDTREEEDESNSELEDVDNIEQDRHLTIDSDTFKGLKKGQF